MRSEEVNLRRDQFTRVREAIPLAGGEVVLGTEQALDVGIALTQSFTFGVFVYTRCSIHNGYADVFLLVRQDCIFEEEGRDFTSFFERQFVVVEFLHRGRYCVLAQASNYSWRRGRV